MPLARVFAGAPVAGAGPSVLLGGAFVVSWLAGLVTVAGDLMFYLFSLVIPEGKPS